jgi:uncharacterized protein
MTRSGIYFGKVTHRRFRPVTHELSYDVASILVDVDELGTAPLPRLLSYNRFNLFAIYDKDHGDMAGETVAQFAWRKVREAGQADTVRSITMLCYPRVLGYGFNPLTTYFCNNAKGQISMMIYEVHNTFGGRHAYVTENTTPDAPNVAKAEKVFRVSPFNKIEGTYILRATEPTDTVSLGVALTTTEGPTLNAIFRGHYKPLNTVQLLRIFFGLPWMSVKIIAAIHWEALKLWRKGLNLAGS